MVGWQNSRHFPQPIRSKNKTNRAQLAHVFPRLAPVTRICSQFWLVHFVVDVCCVWPPQLLRFWFYDTQLKTTLSLRLSLTLSHTRQSRRVKKKSYRRVNHYASLFIGLQPTPSAGMVGWEEFGYFIPRRKRLADRGLFLKKPQNAFDEWTIN